MRRKRPQLPGLRERRPPAGPQARTLNEMLGHTAREVPDSVAYAFKDRSLTFSELEQTIERCAAGLVSLGIGKGDTFGLVLRNCPEFVICAFALARLGATAVPVNFLEKADRIAMIFNDAEVRGCLTAREFLKTVRRAQESVPGLEHVLVRDHADDTPAFDELLHHTLPDSEGPAVTSDDVVLLLYTAGTTGLPKGVMLTHRNLISSVESCALALDVSGADRALCVLPMFHVFAWTTMVLLPLRLGAKTVIVESLLPFQPALKEIRKHRVTLVCCVPQVYSTLVQRVHGPRALLLRLLNPVKLAISGAGPLPAEVQIAFEKKFGTALLEGYGLTEAAPVVSVNPRYGTHKPGSVGLVLPGVKAKILDEDEVELPRGEIGEVCVLGDNVMPGYYNRPEETRAAFTAEGWLKTGDLGYFDSDDYLYLVDRKKDLIIVKGLNVYPQEVEAALTAHAAVLEAAVVGVKDATGDEAIHAFCVLAEGAGVKQKELLSLCRETLASYKIPRSVTFRDELPKNALGKVLKRELRDELARKR